MGKYVVVHEGFRHFNVPKCAKILRVREKGPGGELYRPSCTLGGVIYIPPPTTYLPAYSLHNLLIMYISNPRVLISYVVATYR